MADARQPKNQQLKKNFVDKSAIGERLLHLRKSLLKLTLDEMAKGADCSPQFLNEVERGKKKMGLNVAYAIAENYGVNINWLVEGAGDPFTLEKMEERHADKVIEYYSKKDHLRDAIGDRFVTKDEMDQRLESMMLSLKARMLPSHTFMKVVKPGSADPETIVNVPLHLDMAAGDPRETMEKPERYVTIHPSLLPGGVAPENVVAVVVRGRSMEPKLWSGDIAFIDATIRGAEFYENMICAVRADDDGVANSIKRVLYVDSKMVLISVNAGHPPMVIDETEDMPLGRRIIGRVFGVYHDFMKESSADDL